VGFPIIEDLGELIPFADLLALMEALLGRGNTISAGALVSASISFSSLLCFPQDFVIFNI